jgi:hypothetical protein
VDANVSQSFAFQREDDVLILHLFGPAQAGKIVRRPRLDETKEGLQPRIIRAGKLFSVQLSERLKSSRACLLFIDRNAKSESRIVPEKE